MKKVLFVILVLLVSANMYAGHISGGEMYYKYIGPGNQPNTLKYEVTLRLFRDCSAGGVNVAAMPGEVYISIFDNNGDKRVSDNLVKRDFSMDQNLKKQDFACIQFAPEVCYDVSYFHFEIDLDKNTSGYTCAFQTCCRVGGINNILYNFGSMFGAPGVTISCLISGTALLGPTGINSSPVFKLKDTALVCANNFFSLDFGAIDKDSDSLSYSLCNAYGCAETIRDATAVASGSPSNTTFPPLDYATGFTGNSPMGNNVKINPATGIISGIAPGISGRYVIDVCINEWRNNKIIGSHRKDFILKIADCNKTSAVLNPQYFTCDGYTLSFKNNSTTVSGTQHEWDFGDTASGTDNFSNSPTPTHTYSDTGIYILKLKASINGQCADSSFSIVKVYPGFFPALKVNPPFCKGVPVSFQDATTTRYGVPTGWRWDFGLSNISTDTSIAKNPFFTYPTTGLYKVTLIVGNTFGCIDTVSQDVTIIDKPLLTLLPKDTTYCVLDSIQLKTVTDGPGVFSWTPNANIINANTASPTVFPQVATKYFVTFNQNGCIATDSVFIKPVNDVTADITASAVNICQEDTLTLTGSSNYTNVTWQWSPVQTILNPAEKVTKAFPSVNTQYNLQVNWGRCKASASKTIIVKPLAVPNAGPDAAICKGQATAQLQASGGNSYQWLPATGLSNTNTANPIANPDTTTTYKVVVGVTGCNKTKTDSVTVLVRKLPEINLTNDTLICSIDTLQLQTNATGNFAWSPNYMISSLTNPKPLVSPDIPTTYRVTLTDIFGCISTDSVRVDVKLFVTLNLGNDTTICRTDAVVIRTISDALSYKWTPDIYLDNSSAKQPVATPEVASITYHVIGNIGKCQSSDSITIRTVPYPVPNAGNDTTICFGSSTQLIASGGSSYTWQPVTFLSNSRAFNPTVIKPTTDTKYTVSVTDNLGCPKPVTDDVWVRVYPVVNARTGIGDTSIVIGQTLQMNATGGNQYEWSPATWLSNTNTSSPIAAPEDNIEYKLLVTVVPLGCTGRDSVKIKVYKVPPSFYVPTAFSPNGDGNNEILRPIALGMRSVRYFRVYNRLGQLVFSTTERNKGWDGTYKGNPQDPATFVWMAQGETYTGELITRKGYAVLVR